KSSPVARAASGSRRNARKAPRIIDPQHVNERRMVETVPRLRQPAARAMTPGGQLPGQHQEESHLRAAFHTSGFAGAYCFTNSACCGSALMTSATLVRYLPMKSFTSRGSSAAM